MSETFVLVHGAWLGGWCWQDVVRRLEAAGHTTHAPTFTGLGERFDELTPETGLETYVADVIGTFDAHALSDVVLVGHSLGSIVTNMVADRVPQRIKRMVLVDGGMPIDGHNAFDRIPAQIMAKRMTRAVTVNGVECFPVPPPGSILVPEPARNAWAHPRMTPQTITPYRDRIRLSAPAGSKVAMAYIACTDPPYPVVQASQQKLREDTDWPWWEIATGHNAMLSGPDLLSDALLEIVA
jgi:pimeloyl-ACP methyl ester carboxylesterase